MSRVRFKGGAWTNSEDEVLRASLTVYGLQNWERVASMLVRKTATQCRERWENYLDPRLHIREEWTAEEEEQLVQLQSLFANQWKLIARELSRRSGMNRPAWLCEEHYHSLLDALEYARQQKDDNNNKRNDALSLEDFLEERRRHRAYHQGHETKAARHDAVNSDVFEKEMVEFAVSRLANQDGKKGLRKERKKQLEHTSFLAKLQSNREAIESGTLSAKAKKRMERAMLEDQAGPSNTRLHDGTVEEDDDESEVNEEESRSSKHKKSFRPIDLGADKQEAGIEAKHRVLVKDLKRDKAHLAQGATASEGVNVELLRLTASGGVSAAVGNRLEGKKDKLSIANSASTAPSGSIGSADLDQLFASLPDAITTKKESDVRAPSNPLDDLFRAIPPPVLSSTRPKEGDVALFNDDDHEEDEDSDTSIIISHAPSTQTPSRTVDFSPVEWEACLRRAKKRVLVEAERMFLGPQRVRHRMSPSNGRSQATTVNREDENEYVEVEEKGEDDESTSRIVRALVEQQLPAVAQSLLDEKGISPEALRKKVRRDTEYGSNPYDNISEDEKKKREKKEDLASKLATSVAEVQQGEGAEFWKDVGATEATVQLDELVHHQREQAETATAKDVEAQKRLERIVRICFAGRGQDMRRGGDIIRRACIYWGAQLQDAERQLTFYTAIREAEQKEIQKRLNDAASRLTDIEQRERLLQEQYRSMRLV